MKYLCIKPYKNYLIPGMVYNLLPLPKSFYWDYRIIYKPRHLLSITKDVVLTYLKPI